MCKCNSAIVRIRIIIIRECEKSNTLSGFVHTVGDARCSAVSRKWRGKRGLEKEHVWRGVRCYLCGVVCTTSSGRKGRAGNGNGWSTSKAVGENIADESICLVNIPIHALRGAFPTPFWKRSPGGKVIQL